MPPELKHTVSSRFGLTALDNNRKYLSVNQVCRSEDENILMQEAAHIWSFEQGKYCIAAVRSARIYYDSTEIRPRGRSLLKLLWPLGFDNSQASAGGRRSFILVQLCLLLFCFNISFFVKLKLLRSHLRSKIQEFQDSDVVLLSRELNKNET